MLPSPKLKTINKQNLLAVVSENESRDGSYDQKNSNHPSRVDYRSQADLYH